MEKAALSASTEASTPKPKRKTGNEKERAILNMVEGHESYTYE